MIRPRISIVLKLRFLGLSPTRSSAPTNSVSSGKPSGLLSHVLHRDLCSRPYHCSEINHVFLPVFTLYFKLLQDRELGLVTVMSSDTGIAPECITLLQLNDRNTVRTSLGKIKNPSKCWKTQCQQGQGCSWSSGTAVTKVGKALSVSCLRFSLYVNFCPPQVVKQGHGQFLSFQFYDCLFGRRIRPSFWVSCSEIVRKGYFSLLGYLGLVVHPELLTCR